MDFGRRYSKIFRVLVQLDACSENFNLEVEIEEEGVFPLHFHGESRCDLENLNLAWSLNSILGEFLVSIVRPVVTEYC